jgi:hypothetical protein
MNERTSTLVCIFDQRSPRISAYDIHEWINDNLKLDEPDIQTIQVDGPRRQVYIKFYSEEKMKGILRVTTGTSEYKHENGEISQVRIEIAGMGIPPRTKGDSDKGSTSKIRGRNPDTRGDVGEFIQVQGL